MSIGGRITLINVNSGRITSIGAVLSVIPL
jgi:hypothetical protein